MRLADRIVRHAEHNIFIGNHTMGDHKFIWLADHNVRHTGYILIRGNPTMIGHNYHIFLSGLPILIIIVGKHTIISEKITRAIIIIDAADYNF